MEFLLKDVLEKLIASPNVVSRRPIFERYDKNVQGNTAHERGAVAAAITTCFRDFPELDETHSRKGVALGIGGNPSIARISAKEAAIDAIAQSYLQISCVGGEPLGATDCLNFGNPEKPDQMADFVEGVDGIKEVCEALETPIVSGNVSLYNEASGKPIPPSAMVSVFARVDEVENVRPIAFQHPGEKVFVLGKRSGNFGGSELLRVLGKQDTRLPGVDYKHLQNLVGKIKDALNEQKISSITQIGRGGVIMAGLQSAFEGGKGLIINISDEADIPLLFGEDLGVVVTTNDPEALQQAFGDDAWEIGAVDEKEALLVQVNGKVLLDTNIVQWKKDWNDHLRHVL